MDDPLTRGFDGVMIIKSSNMQTNPIRFLNFSGRVYFFNKALLEGTGKWGI
jgi:hypothetical protein